MLGKNDIVEASYDAIVRGLGVVAASHFNELVRSANNGVGLSVENAPPAEQIKTINSFWRQRLASVADSTNIRTWLCEGDDINAYIHAFENNWMRDIHKVGLI